MLVRKCDRCMQSMEDDYVVVSIKKGPEHTDHKSFEFCTKCLPYGSGRVTADGLIGAIKRVLGLR